MKSKVYCISVKIYSDEVLIGSMYTSNSWRHRGLACSLQTKLVQMSRCWGFYEGGNYHSAAIMCMENCAQHSAQCALTGSLQLSQQPTQQAH